jgi:predicted ATPase
VAAMIFQALTLWPLGETERAHRVAEEAITHAPTTNHIATVAYTLVHVSILGLLCRDIGRVSQRGEALAVSAISREHGLRFWFGYGAFATGYARWHNGEREAGAMDMFSGIGMLREQGISWCLPLLQSVYAEAEAQVGHFDSALSVLDGALVLGEQTGQRWIEADLHRVRGEILLGAARPDLAAAEAALSRAIDIARSQRARTFELRAAVSLARLFHRTERAAEAQSLLTSALHGFSQTHRLPEIEQARRLLSSPTQ